MTQASVQESPCICGAISHYGGRSAYPDLGIPMHDFRARVTLEHIETCRGVVEAITEVARTGQTLAGAKRQVEMAEAERDEAAIHYFRAQKELAKALMAARRACGEPTNL